MFDRFKANNLNVQLYIKPTYDAVLPADTNVTVK